jgi:hypothetical protein
VVIELDHGGGGPVEGDPDRGRALGDGALKCSPVLDEAAEVPVHADELAAVGRPLQLLAGERQGDQLDELSCRCLPISAQASSGSGGFGVSVSTARVPGASVGTGRVDRAARDGPHDVDNGGDRRLARTRQEAVELELVAARPAFPKMPWRDRCAGDPSPRSRAFLTVGRTLRCSVMPWLHR